ncbi:MAG: hypothetical protein AAFX87_25340 [Bacteroidota bacterium]
MAHFITLIDENDKKIALDVSKILRVLEDSSTTSLVYNSHTTYDKVKHSVEDVMKKITGFEFPTWS